jgi:hypothetical protein
MVDHPLSDNPGEASMIELFKEHPATVGETYWQHLCFAARTGAAMVAGGGACVIHGLLPFLFVTTGSRTIRMLAQKIEWRHGTGRSLPASEGGRPRFS